VLHIDIRLGTFHSQGSHSPGKTGKLLEFCKPGKLLENFWNFMLDLEFLV